MTSTKKMEATNIWKISVKLVPNNFGRWGVFFSIICKVF